MKSPFPGMNPFLELHWGDVRHALVVYMCDQIRSRLSDDLRARIDDRTFVESYVSRLRQSIDAQPYIFELHDLELTEGFIEIRERGGGRVVTVIEILSRANKFPGAGSEHYRKKQDEVLHSDASLVEIDLVRAGRRMISLPTVDISEKHRSDYLICVSPGWNRSRRELYAMPLMRRLPIIRIPLRQTDTPVTVDLQALVDRAYEAGRYDDIDYSQELDPPLSVDEAAWVKSLLVPKAAP